MFAEESSSERPSHRGPASEGATWLDAGPQAPPSETTGQHVRSLESLDALPESWALRSKGLRPVPGVTPSDIGDGGLKRWPRKRHGHDPIDAAEKQEERTEMGRTPTTPWTQLSALFRG